MTGEEFILKLLNKAEKIRIFPEESKMKWMTIHKESTNEWRIDYHEGLMKFFQTTSPIENTSIISILEEMLNQDVNSVEIEFKKKLIQ